MKEKIFLFIIGFLLGAVISTGALYIYTINKSNDCSSNTTTQMGGGQPPEMSNGQNSENGEPPEKPDGEQGEPPEKPSDDNSQNDNA